MKRQELRRQYYIIQQEIIKKKWNNQIAAAKITWDKITEAELLKIEGHEERLIVLIQKRYVMSRYNAEEQVKGFFNSY